MKTRHEVVFSHGPVIFLTALIGFMNSSFAVDSIAPQLKLAIEKSKPKLGEFSSWQEEAFLNEVLMSPGRFVKDYSTQGNTANRIVVDTDGIKKYLSFHASQILKPENMKTLLAVTGTEKCTACIGAVPFVRKDLKARLENRGLVAIVLNASESRRDLSELSGSKNAAGWVHADIKSVEDFDHPGEIKYELILEMRFPGTAASRIQKQMEVLQNDSIEVGMSRVAIDALMELGSKVQLARMGALATEENEGVEVTIAGVSRYSQLLGLKRALQDGIGAEGRVIEKRLLGEQSVLAVFSTLSAEAISKVLLTAKLEGMKFRLRSTSPKDIQGSVSSTGGSK